MKKYLRLSLSLLMLALIGRVEAAPVQDAVPADESMFLSGWGSSSNTMRISSEAAAAWTLRYPTLFSSSSVNGTVWAKPLKEYENGHLLEAMIAFDQVPKSARNAEYFVYRAHFLLLMGNESEAAKDLHKALSLAPKQPKALALEAILSLRKGRNKQALAQAKMAVSRAHKLPAAYLALSYAQQASGNLSAARTSVETVRKLAPSSPLAYLRLAELDLAFGNSGQAEVLAAKAVKLAPSLPDARDVFGFVQLSEQRPALAAASFKNAVRLNSLEPAGHFGLGLADIQMGKLKEGRKHLETAATLAPGNALPRSYLGRLDDQLGRDHEAAEQYRQASMDDPNDPVPYHFDAVRLAEDNAPVSAKEKLRLALNRVSNRAVYRTPNLLAEDRALNLADLSAMDRVLGENNEARLDATRALAEAFDSSAAHRALGDALAGQSRAGLARQSEYLQALLREPLGVLPPPLSVAEGIEPGAVVPQHGFFRAASPGRTGYNEFGAVFNSAAPSIDLDVTGGGRGSLGDQLRAATAVQNLGLSFSQLHFETNGFGSNDNLDNTVWRGTLQYDPDPEDRLHLDYQTTNQHRMGELFANDPTAYQPQSVGEQRNRGRAAWRHVFGESNALILLASREHMKQGIGVQPTPNNFLASTENDQQTVRSDVLEAQYLYRHANWRLVTGISRMLDTQTYTYGAADYGVYGQYPSSSVDYSFDATDVYGYGLFRVNHRLMLETGLAADDLNSNGFKQHMLSPKLGLTWQAVPGGTLHVAAMRSLNRFFISGQTLEPTEVAGFQQYYNDSLGIRSDRVGLLWEQRLRRHWSWGLEASGRRLRVPIGGAQSPYDHWRERDDRIWLSRNLPKADLAGWLPGWQGSLTLAYDGQQYIRHGYAFGTEQIRDYRPRHVRLAGHLFDSAGWGLDMGLTWVQTRGTWVSLYGTDTTFGTSFPVADASVSWALPHRYGQLSLGVLNLFDRRFQYLEMDPSNPRFAPERYIYARVRLVL